jgi:hypothetical protein
MSENRLRKIQVYAIVRLDLFIDNQEHAVTVKEVVPTLDEAEAEVKRLNLLNSDKDCRYFWQATRYFPDGRASPRESDA